MTVLPLRFFFYHFPRASESRKKRLQWSNDDIIGSYECSSCDQKVTISEAAKKYNVPRKTLDNRIKERVEHGSQARTIKLY